MQVQGINTTNNNYNTNFKATLKLTGNRIAFPKPFQEFVQQRTASFGNPNDVITLNLSKPYPNSRKIVATTLYNGKLIDNQKDIGYTAKNKIEEHEVSTFFAICNYLIGLRARTSNLSTEEATRQFLFFDMDCNMERQYTDILNQILTDEFSTQDYLRQIPTQLFNMDMHQKQGHALLKQLKLAMQPGS